MLFNKLHLVFVSAFVKVITSIVDPYNTFKGGDFYEFQDRSGCLMRKQAKDL
jgi:hypothetical protein